MPRGIWIALAALSLGCASEPWREWRSPLERDHPLAGRVFDTATRAELTPGQLVDRLAGARYVLLGEKHDNADHHALQAWIVDRLGRRGTPTVVLEMLDRDQREALAAHLRERSVDVDGLARVTRWSERGWPDWRIYRPIFAAALRRGLSLEPGNFDRRTLDRMREGDPKALSDPLARHLLRDAPASPELRASLAGRIRDAHCGFLPEAAVGSMVEIQSARDAQLAASMFRAAGPSGAVLIAGAGHVGRQAVPRFLRAAEPTASILSLGFVELSPESAEPREDLTPGFDFVWLTPRVDDQNPCEKFRHRLEKLSN